MTLSDHRTPWRVEEFLLKDPLDYTRRDWEYADHLVQAAIESPEGEATRWKHLMRRQSTEQPRVHYRDAG